MKCTWYDHSRLGGDKKRPLAKDLPKVWLDEAGDPLPEEKLKKISAKWSPDHWEAYLQSQEGNLKEKLGLKLDVHQRVEIFASRGDEDFQKNAEQDLSEAHAMEAEQTFYLKPLVLSEEEKAFKEISDASDKNEQLAACVRCAI